MSPDIQVPVRVLWLRFRFDGPSPANFPRNKVSRYFWVPFYRVESEIKTDTDPKLAQPFWFVPSFFAQRHPHLKNTAHCLFCTQLSFARDGQVNETIGLWLWYGQDGLIFRFSLLLIGVVRLQEGRVFWKCLNGLWICCKGCDLEEGNCVWSHVFDFAWKMWVVAVWMIFGYAVGCKEICRTWQWMFFLLDARAKSCVREMGIDDGNCMACIWSY